MGETARITDVEFFLVELPCDAGLGAARCWLVRLASDAGLEGWGEARLDWRPAELAARRDSLAPVLAARSVFDVEELLRLDAIREPALRSAVETACWDLIGRTTGQPLCHLWGGHYRRRIPLAVHLPNGPAPEVAQVARQWAEFGFHEQILVSRGKPEEDLANVQAIRQAASDRAELSLDGRAAYDLPTAHDLCAELEYARLRCFLDPVGASTFHEVAALGRQTSVPLGVARMLRGPADVLAMVRCGAGRIALLDPERLGGPSAVRRSAAIAEASETGMAVACGPSAGPAVALLLHLAAATPALAAANPCDYPQLREDVLAEPLEVVDGMIAVPQGPGLGVQVDRAKVERYQIA
ncbi:MAG: hypothetical protein JW809_17750 [Pirellulales bacterium]|nr:hypothetical protein [Pirellulales bacterium]